MARKRFNPETGELEDFDADATRTQPTSPLDQPENSTSFRQPIHQPSFLPVVAVVLGALLLLFAGNSINNYLKTRVAAPPPVNKSSSQQPLNTWTQVPSPQSSVPTASEAITVLKQSPDGQFAIATIGARTFDSGTIDNLYIVDLISKKKVLALDENTFAAMTRNTYDRAVQIVWSPDSSRLAVYVGRKGNGKLFAFQKSGRVFNQLHLPDVDARVFQSSQYLNKLKELHAPLDHYRLDGDWRTLKEWDSFGNLHISITGSLLGGLEYKASTNTQFYSYEVLLTLIPNQTGDGAIQDISAKLVSQNDGVPVVEETTSHDATLSAIPEAAQSSQKDVADPIPAPATSLAVNTPAIADMPHSENTGSSITLVDMNTVFTSYDKTKQAENDLNAARSVAKQELDNRLKVLNEKMNVINQTPKSSSSYNRLVAEAKRLDSAITEFRKKREDKLQEQFVSMREVIIKNISRKVNDVCGAKADMILDKSGMSKGQIPFLIVSPDSAEATSEVIQSLNNAQSDAFQGRNDFQIGVLDMNKIFTSYYKTKTAEVALNQSRAEAKKELDQRIGILNQKVVVVNKTDESSTKHATLLAEAKQLDKEITEFRAMRERQLQEHFVRERKAIIEDIMKTIKSSLRLGNDALLLDISGLSIDGTPFLLFTRKVPNYTEGLIFALNENSSSPSSQAYAADLNMPLSSMNALRFALVDVRRVLHSLPDTRDLMSQASAQNSNAKDQEMVTGKLNAAVKQIQDFLSASSNLENVDLVIDSSALSMGKITVLVESHGVPDLTDKCIQTLSQRNNVSLTSSGAASTPVPLSREIDSSTFPGERFPETRSRILSNSDVAKWSDDKLRYAINEMYARHSAEFRDKDIKRHFSGFSWYHPGTGKSYDDAETEFSDIEKRNVDFLGSYRSSRKEISASSSSVRKSSPSVNHNQPGSFGPGPGPATYGPGPGPATYGPGPGPATYPQSGKIIHDKQYPNGAWVP